MVDLENCQNAGILKLSESAFHKFEELLFHFRAEEFVRFFVVIQEKEFEFWWIKFVNVFLDFCIYFFQELFMGAVKFFHQMIKPHDFMGFDQDKVLIDVFEGLTDPWVFIPVMFLLTLNSWKVIKAGNDLFMSKEFQVLESKKDFVWWKSLPSDGFWIVNKKGFGGFVQESVADGDSDGELQRIISEIWWANDCFQLIYFGFTAVLFESLVKIEYFSRFGPHREMIGWSESKGGGLAENGGSDFEHTNNNLYY